MYTTAQNMSEFFICFCRTTHQTNKTLFETIVVALQWLHTRAYGQSHGRDLPASWRLGMQSLNSV